MASNVLHITVRQVPQIELHPSDTSVLYGHPVPFRVGVSGSFRSYEWKPSAGLMDPAVLNAVALPEEMTRYLLIVNNEGCRDSVYATVDITKNALYIPSSFTPNNDSKNDMFRVPPVADFFLHYLSVFDRWGNRVFHTTVPGKGWDGSHQGQPCPTGAYVYVLKGTDPKGAVIRKGTVILIR